MADSDTEDGSGVMAATDTTAARDVAHRDEPPSSHAPTSTGSLTTAVTYVMASSGQTFVVHTDLLRYWSPKLHNMLETGNNQLRLKIGAKVLGIVLHWFYTQKLYGLWVDANGGYGSAKIIQVEGNEELEDFESYYHQQHEYYALEAYIFAATYGIKRLQNDIIDDIYRFQGFALQSSAIVLKAYRHLPPTSAFLQFLVDTYAKNYKVGSYISSIPEELILRKQLPNAFTVSWLLKLLDSSFKDKKLQLKDYYEPVE